MISLLPGCSPFQQVGQQQEPDKSKKKLPIFQYTDHQRLLDFESVVKWKSPAPIRVDWLLSCLGYTMEEHSSFEGSVRLGRE